MLTVAELPWRKIAHAIGYWLLSVWLIFISLLVVSELVEVYTRPDEYRQVFYSFAFYKATWWLYFALLVIAVVAQARRIRQQRISLTALCASATVPAMQAVIWNFDLNPTCCT